MYNLCDVWLKVVRLANMADRLAHFQVVPNGMPMECCDNSITDGEASL